MKTNPHNPQTAAAGDETLRLIANLPAPAGLEDRIHAALHKAPRERRILAWPAGRHWMVNPRSGWVRSAAAAAIVFAVVGGGWGVYMRVTPNQLGKGPSKVIVMPRVMAPGGFSGAGAMRTPQTLPGSVERPPSKQTAAPKPAKKLALKSTLRPLPAIAGPGR